MTPHRIRTKFSASQLKLFTECQRKWGFRYIENIEAPPNKFAQQGLDMHAALEQWLKNSIPPNLSTTIGKLIFPGLQHLPSPGPHIEVERKFEFQTKYEYVGYVDFAHPTPDNIPLVGDHKTTVDFKWALSPHELTKNIQANLYAFEAQQRYQSNHVDLSWIYYRTRGTPASLPVRVRRPKDDILEQFSKIELIANDIQTAKALPVTELPKNLSMCEAYGGCPYLARCQLSATERMSSLMSSNTLVERLKARNAGTPANGTPPPGTQPLQAVPPQAVPPPQLVAPPMAVPQQPPQPVYAPVPQAGPASQVAGQAGYAQQPVQPVYAPLVPQPTTGGYVPSQQTMPVPQPVYVQPAPTGFNPPEQMLQAQPLNEEQPKQKRKYTKREKPTDINGEILVHTLLQCAALIGKRTPEEAQRAFELIMEEGKDA